MLKIGCPGFIFIKEFEKDFQGALNRIGALGFDGIEITGFFGKSAEEIKNACAQAGLTPFGSFVRLEDMLCRKPDESMPEVYRKMFDTMAAQGETLDEKLEYVKAIGCEYIGLTFGPTEPTPEWLADIKVVADAAKAHGLKIYYHNHDHEYNNMVAGKRRMDIIMENLPENVLLEPDLGWMAIGGYEPMKCLKEYKDRIAIVHLKDYMRRGEDKLDMKQGFRFCPTGYGVMDWAQILDFTENEIHPDWYVTDHDNAYDGDIYEELKMSLEYVKKQIGYLKY